MKVHLLAIGVHPDDVELSCSGVIINEVKAGKKVAIVDMTQGELGTRGTVDSRYQEAATAAMIMGVQARENLKMRDGFFVNDEENKLKLITAIRKYQPEIIFANALEDRHPDHGRAGKMIAECAFLAGLSKIETKDEAGRVQEKWKPAYVLHYIQDWFREPDFIVDISDVFEQRMEAIAAYGTQFHNPADNSGEPQTYISTPEFFEAVIARARMIGKRIGVKYAEGFNTEKTIGIRSLDALVCNQT
ncbi:MAG: bacillithiol biosynthesis deacetylase BshB1 [Chitinophagaceae bacterium]|nr:bacillithiol biosynthesis deacetylase BshB1 [Chitinophagaceae bacterium]